MGFRRTFEFMSAMLTYFSTVGNFCQAFRRIANEKASWGGFSRNFLSLPWLLYTPTLVTAAVAAKPVENRR
jgi:hypothetical protein